MVRDDIVYNYCSERQFMGRRQTDVTRKRISEALKGKHSNASWAQKNSTFLQTNMRRAQQLQSTQFTDLEKELLPRLENRFGKLYKEKINNYYCDFSNDKVIIEYTVDVGHGVRSATTRFEDCRSDLRRKILICPSYGFGKKRKEKIASLGVEWSDLSLYRA